jgi:hypothetical protein
MLDPVLMTIPQMREAAALGAYIEFVYNALIGPNKSFDMPDYAKTIRAVGINSTILSSDLGKPQIRFIQTGWRRFSAV